MPLNQDEKVAGRWWLETRQAELDALNQARPPKLLVPSFGAHFRHNCEARQGRSTSFELKEQYELNPDIWVCYCNAIGIHGPDFPHDNCRGGKSLARAGVLAWIWKEGKCACGMTARSRQGFIAVAADRPPLRKAA